MACCLGLDRFPHHQKGCFGWRKWMQFNLHLHKFKFAVNFIRRPFCHILMQAEALRLLKQADFQEINVKDTVQLQDLPLYFTQSCSDANGWKLKDLDGLSLLDHAALGGMRMLSPRRGSTRRTKLRRRSQWPTWQLICQVYSLVVACGFSAFWVDQRFLPNQGEGDTIAIDRR